MKKRAHYICFEGTEGVGKTTQTQKLVEYLTSKGYKVLQTKEPGTHLSPLTMKLRGLMLDNQYDAEMTQEARELISQAIRSVHMQRVVYPAMSEYDFIVQDRGILSGLAYGKACGNDLEFLEELAERVSFPGTGGNIYSLYDNVIYLKGNIEKGLKTALSAKQEFETGDAMEARGLSFMEQVSANMTEMSEWFMYATTVDVDGKNIEQVFADILKKLQLEEKSDG